MDAPRFDQFTEMYVFDSGMIRHVIKQEGPESWSWTVSAYEGNGRYWPLDSNSTWAEYPKTLEEAYAGMEKHYLGFWEYNKKYKEIVAAREREAKREFSFYFEDVDEEDD